MPVNPDRNEHKTAERDRRRARKFARASKRCVWWRDVPYALRERPQPRKGGA